MTVTCPECFTPARVPGAAAGRRVRCKQCGEAFRAEPGPAAAPAPPPARRGRAVKTRRKPTTSPVSPAFLKAAAAAAAVAAVAGGGLWLYLNADAVADRAAGLAEASGLKESPDDRSARLMRERAAENWTSGFDPRWGSAGKPADADALRERMGGYDPSRSPKKDPAAERKHAERIVARLKDRQARGATSSVGRVTSGDRVFASGPSTYPFGGPPVAVADGPVRAVRVRRARYDGYAAVREITFLDDPGDAGDVLPGEAADAAPDGHELAGVDVAFGYFVYAVRPLWVPEGGPLDGTGAVTEGAWLGERGGWPTARLRPTGGRRFAGLYGPAGRLLDGLGVLTDPADADRTAFARRAAERAAEAAADAARDAGVSGPPPGRSVAPDRPRKPGDAASVYRSGGR